jgi:hypothetical protein
VGDAAERLAGGRLPAAVPAHVAAGGPDGQHTSLLLLEIP